MFSKRDLGTEVAAVREEHAPEAYVFDVERDFETLDPAQAEGLGMFVESLDLNSFQEEWVPADAPDALHRLVGTQFTIGMPGDGGVAWTRQTVPPSVLVKQRVASSPEAFVDFLIAEALVQVGLETSEHFLGFFRSKYLELDAAVPLSPASTYQLATALFDAYLGLATRHTFHEWKPTYPRLSEAWRDAGSRLEPRISDLPREMAHGELEFAVAAELACSAVKHSLDLPPPFTAIDAKAYRTHGPDYAVQWAEKTFEKLEED